MPGRKRQPGQDQRQGVGACHAVPAPERKAEDRHQREHGYALIPAKGAGHLTEHFADEERAKRCRKRDQEGEPKLGFVSGQVGRISHAQSPADLYLNDAWPNH